jgi:hypothetical protein
MWEAKVIKYYKRLPGKTPYKIVSCFQWKWKTTKGTSRSSNQILKRSKKLKG